MTTPDELLTDANWDDVAKTLPTTALPVGGIPGQKSSPAPVVEQPRHVGDLPEATPPRGYGIAFTLARNAWKRATNDEEMA